MGVQSIKAAHRVLELGSLGYCVKIPYKGYTISLGASGRETVVIDKFDRRFLHHAKNTDGEALSDCIEFINKLEKENAEAGEEDRIR